MSNRVVIDPVTRIEGHLRLEAVIENGVVTDAYSAGTTVRGIEKILKGRDPRDAWAIAERVCGVCTTSHALVSVRAVEDALGVQVPRSAELIRNVMCCAQQVQDHVIHFYHLHALDWVDVVSMLKADPAEAAKIAPPCRRASNAWSKAASWAFLPTAIGATPPTSFRPSSI
jgi:hydrogenase large subunit